MPLRSHRLPAVIVAGFLLAGTLFTAEADPAAAAAPVKVMQFNICGAICNHGKYGVVEHVRADDDRLARRQARLAHPWRAFAAGCHCDRPTLDLLRAHFPSVVAERATWRGMPRIVHPLVTGYAEAAR